MRTANFVLVTILFVSMVAGCTPQAVQKPVDQVNLQLKWVHQAQAAGFYMAQEKGYYAKENIAVTFLEGGPGIGNVEQVVSGKAGFGIESPDTIILNRSQGKPVVAVACIYRRSPLVFIALSDSGIKQPSGFIGKSIAIGGAGTDATLQLYALMKKLNLDAGQVKIVPYDYNYVTFIDGTVPLAYTYTTGGLIRILQKGCKVNQILPGEYGIHVFADTLFTTDSMIAENPDLVTRFLRASLQGWKDTVGNPAEAVKATMKYAKEKDELLQTKMLEASLPLVHTGEDQIGWMRTADWEDMLKMLLEQGLLDKPIDPGSACNLEFINKIYGGKTR